MELTDKNATGNYTNYSFTKGESAEQLNPNDVSSFAAVNVRWTPVASLLDIKKAVKPTLFPNPSTGLFYLKHIQTAHVQVWDVNGAIVFEAEGATINLLNQPNGIYFVKIESGNQNYVMRLLKE